MRQALARKKSPLPLEIRPRRISPMRATGNPSALVPNSTPSAAEEMDTGSVAEVNDAPFMVGLLCLKVLKSKPPPG
jgi:hypothetical protein